MKKTIFAILTKKTARQAHIIARGLDKEFKAGLPWFTKLNESAINIK